MHNYIPAMLAVLGLTVLIGIAGGAVAAVRHRIEEHE